MEYYEKRLKSIKYPAVIVCREKHGTSYWNATTEEELLKSCLLLVKTRLSNRYYPTTEDLKRYKPKRPDELLSDEEIGNLPEIYKREQLKIKDRYTKALKEWEFELQEAKDIEEAVKTNNHKLAFIILSERSGHEYEGFEVFKLYSGKE